MIEVFLF
ncbi:hypothetical protein Pint_21243 [Pistacia integerrima]